MPTPPLLRGCSKLRSGAWSKAQPAEERWHDSTDALKVVERISVLDDSTLRYEYTMTDPKTWTKSWSVEAPLPRIDPPLYEFACHEQNYGLINLVMGAQITATKAGSLK